MNPSIPRKFSLGRWFNGSRSAADVRALLSSASRKIPSGRCSRCLESIDRELCFRRSACRWYHSHRCACRLAWGGCFLSTASHNLSGIFAGQSAAKAHDHRVPSALSAPSLLVADVLACCVHERAADPECLHGEYFERYRPRAERISAAAASPRHQSRSVHTCRGSRSQRARPRRCAATLASCRAPAARPGRRSSSRAHWPQHRRRLRAAHARRTRPASISPRRTAHSTLSIAVRSATSRAAMSDTAPALPHPPLLTDSPKPFVLAAMAWLIVFDSTDNRYGRKRSSSSTA